MDIQNNDNLFEYSLNMKHYEFISILHLYVIIVNGFLCDCSIICLNFYFCFNNNFSITI